MRNMILGRSYLKGNPHDNDGVNQPNRLKVNGGVAFREHCDPPITDVFTNEALKFEYANQSSKEVCNSRVSFQVNPIVKDPEVQEHICRGLLNSMGIVVGD